MSEGSPGLSKEGKRTSAPRPRTGRKKVVRKPIRTALLRLLFFTVLVAVLPLGIVAVVIVVRDGWTAFSVHKIWHRGELALIAVAIIADGCGSLFPGSEDSPLLRVVLGGASFVMAGLAVAWFVLAQVVDNFNPMLNTVFQLIFFASALIIGGAAKSISEAQR